MRIFRTLRLAEKENTIPHHGSWPAISNTSSQTSYTSPCASSEPVGTFKPLQCSRRKVESSNPTRASWIDENMVDNETYYVTAQDQKKVIGPVTPTQITAALEQGRLKPKHLVSHSPEGPWQTLEVVFASASNQSPSLGKQKKPTKQSQATKGHVTAPPKDRAELKKWLQANKDQSSVSCPHCSASVKHSNLLQHCDKLHYSRLSTTGSSQPVSQAATKNPAGKSKNPMASVTTPPKDRCRKLMKWLQSNWGLIGLGGHNRPFDCPTLWRESVASVA